MKPKVNIRRTADGRPAPEYSSWLGMRARCNTPTNHAYHNYGGRGIAVCPEWEASFEAFLRDMGPRPSPDHSVDRIDNDGPYSPENCRWATHQEQANNKRNNSTISLEGESKTQAEWIRETGLSRSALMRRTQRGLTPGEILDPATHFRLTELDAVAIREEFDKGAGRGELAERFGVSRDTVNGIIAGRIWSKAGGPITPRRPRKKLQNEDAWALSQRHKAGERLVDLAEECSMTPSGLRSALKRVNRLKAAELADYQAQRGTVNG